MPDSRNLDLPHDTTLHEALDQALQALEPAAPPLDEARVAGRIMAQVRQPASSSQPLQRPFASSGWPRSRRWSVTLASAGIVAATVLVGLWRSASPEVVGQRVYATKNAERAVVRLADGSDVLLAPGSRLEMAPPGSATRHVTLEGQAYFTVQQDMAHPFVVQTGTVATRVIGTAFDIRRYAGDSSARIAVISGKVASGTGGSPVILTPGMIAHVSDAAAGVMTGVDLSSITGWTQGRLVFTNTPLPVVLESASRWYGYEFRIVDSALAQRKVTIGLTVGNLEEMLRVLGVILNAGMHIEGDTVVLSLQNAPPARPVRLPNSDTAIRHIFHRNMEVGK